MRLIDADALKRVVYDANNVAIIGDHIEYMSKDAIYDIVDAEKTIDAVGLVRCWDCIHSRELLLDRKEPEIMICINKNMFPMRTSPGFYCAHGERKMDAEVEG